MNPQELLANTQSSVCSAETVSVLEHLKKFRQDQKNQGKELQKCQADLKELIQKNVA